MAGMESGRSLTNKGVALADQLRALNRKLAVQLGQEEAEIPGAHLLEMQRVLGANAMMIARLNPPDTTPCPNCNLSMAIKLVQPSLISYTAPELKCRGCNTVSHAKQV